jgi:protein-S-isoprenylcysteine O-methyltransferase Ste14
LRFATCFFTMVVPGAGAVYAPWWILTHGSANPQPVAWYALILVTVGLALYAWCLWLFATVGRATPGPWDAPRRFVAIGPYRWFFVASAVGVCRRSGHRMPTFRGLVEQPALHTLFGDEYDDYRRSVSRWIPRPPRQPELNSLFCKQAGVVRDAGKGSGDQRRRPSASKRRRWHVICTSVA